MTWTTTLKRGEGVAIDGEVLTFERVDASLIWWRWRGDALCVTHTGLMRLDDVLVTMRRVSPAWNRVTVSVDALAAVTVEKVCQS